MYLIYTHEKTGVHHIVDYCGSHLSEDEDYYLNYTLTYRSGIAKIFNPKDTDSKNIAEKMNRFWSGARGYEKVGKVDCTGIPVSGIYNGIRLWLKQCHNHACMLGDIDTVKSTKKANSWFYSRCNRSPKPNVYTLLLTA